MLYLSVVSFNRFYIISGILFKFMELSFGLILEVLKSFLSTSAKILNFWTNNNWHGWPNNMTKMSPNETELADIFIFIRTEEMRYFI